MQIQPAYTDLTLQKKLQAQIDGKTKPLGALGRLEEIALQVGMIQQTTHPHISQPHILVFAADHGIAATGLVNPYPQAVTAQMALNFLRGGAAINVFCRQHAIGLKVVDAGVNFDFDGVPSSEKLIREKIGYGTQNYLEGNAMSRDEVLRAMEAGKRVIEDLFKEGCNCVGLGEMGIGNTSAASLIMSVVTGIPLDQCIGKGTGMNEAQLEIKRATLEKAAKLHFPALSSSPDPELILQHIGGFEIAMMAGAYQKASELKMIILVDGFITTAALLVARLTDPLLEKNCIFSHRSGEQGHEKMLRYLDASPLLNLGMRLGEGTGAAMAFPIVQSALLFLQEMASFESAGVSRK
ncbi:nicotinate-nucleotide--dimethylbenzimidazole phosphoribosyltransferase [Flavitalea flava]